MAASYDPTSAAGRVRLLLSDVAAPFVFTDGEITAFLDLEGGSVKRAAAQAIDTNATNEALASKVITDADGKSTNGASVADAMRKHAAALRAQADAEEARDAAAAEEDGFFDVVPLGQPATPLGAGWARGGCW